MVWGTLYSKTIGLSWTNLSHNNFQKIEICKLLCKILHNYVYPNSSKILDQSNLQSSAWSQAMFHIYNEF